MNISKKKIITTKTFSYEKGEASLSFNLQTGQNWENFLSILKQSVKDVETEIANRDRKNN